MRMALAILDRRAGAPTSCEVEQPRAPGDDAGQSGADDRAGHADRTIRQRDIGSVQASGSVNSSVTNELEDIVSGEPDGVDVE
jgi:hypothetical protein